MFLNDCRFFGRFTKIYCFFWILANTCVCYCNGLALLLSEKRGSLFSHWKHFDDSSIMFSRYALMHIMFTRSFNNVFFSADMCKCLHSNTGMYQEQRMLNEYQRSKHK